VVLEKDGGDHLDWEKRSRVTEQNTHHAVKGRKAKSICQNLHMNCLLKDVTEGKVVKKRKLGRNGKQYSINLRNRENTEI
jgi:hypothetical protein